MKIAAPRIQPAFPARRCALYLLAAALLLELILGDAHAAAPAAVALMLP